MTEWNDLNRRMKLKCYLYEVFVKKYEGDFFGFKMTYPPLYTLIIAAIVLLGIGWLLETLQ